MGDHFTVFLNETQEEKTLIFFKNRSIVTTY